MDNEKINTEYGLKDVVLTIKGTQLSDWYIQSGDSPIESLELHKDNFGILGDVTKIVFYLNGQIGHSEFDLYWYLKGTLWNLVSSLCKNLLDYEIVYEEDYWEYQDAKEYYCENGILYKAWHRESTTFLELLQYPIGRKDETVYVCSEKQDWHVISISPGAFCGAVHIKKVMFPECIKEIGKDTFKNCISLETVESAPLTAVSEDAFENCYSLKKLNISEVFEYIEFDQRYQVYDKQSHEFRGIHSNIRIRLSEDMCSLLEVIPEFDKGPEGWNRIFYQNIIYYPQYIGYCGKNIQCVLFSDHFYGNEIALIEGEGVLNADNMSHIFRENQDVKRYLIIGNKITGFEKNFQSTVEGDKWKIFGYEYECVRIGENIDRVEEYVFGDSQIDKVIAADTVKFLWPGDFGYYVFGKHNGRPLKWIVLASQGEKILIISCQPITKAPYHNKNDEDITWKTSSLRKWLNTEFIETAFSEDELNRICVTRVEDCGSISDDKIYLLSNAELDEYLPEHGWAQEDVKSFDENEWWLRTTTRDDDETYGSTYAWEPGKAEVDDSDVGVRPVMWVNL